MVNGVCKALNSRPPLGKHPLASRVGHSVEANHHLSPSFLWENSHFTLMWILETLYLCGPDAGPRVGRSKGMASSHRAGIGPPCRRSGRPPTVQPPSRSDAPRYRYCKLTHSLTPLGTVTRDRPRSLAVGPVVYDNRERILPFTFTFITQ